MTLFHGSSCTDEPERSLHGTFPIAQLPNDTTAHDMHACTPSWCSLGVTSPFIEARLDGAAAAHQHLEGGHSLPS